MKTSNNNILWKFLVMAAYVFLTPQCVKAAGATSTEINNAIVQEGSIPLTWENDPDYPWTIDTDGKLKSGNSGISNSSSKLKLKFSSVGYTTVSFNLQTSSTTAAHALFIYVNGNIYPSDKINQTGGYIQFRLPLGNHVIEIEDLYSSIPSGYNPSLKLYNVRITETIPAKSADLNNTIVLDNSAKIEWQNDSHYPWVICDGKAKSGNFGFKKTTSDLTFSYSTETTSLLSFNCQSHYNSYNYNANFFTVCIDGEQKLQLSQNSSIQAFNFYLPKGKHIICLSDSIGDSDSYNNFTEVWDVKALEFDRLESTILTAKSLPISFNDTGMCPWYTENSCAKSSNHMLSNSSSTLQSEINIDKPSVLSFHTKNGYAGSDHKSRFYINGEIYYESDNSNWNYVSVALQPGKYSLEWRDENKYSGNNYYSLIKDVELSQDCVEVDITPGMLGVEVLYKVNALTNVEMLKVKGTLNDSDWATIKMMSNVKFIDLSEATADRIADYQFKSLKFLSTVKLPEGIKSIGREAFVGTNIYYLTIPSSVESIGRQAFANTPIANIDFEDNSKLTSIGCQAFYYCEHLKEFIMPDSVITLETESSGSTYAYTFYECNSLKKIKFSDSLTYIPDRTCYENSAVEELHLPKSLITIGANFMDGATSLKELNLPESVRSIGDEAFYGLHQLEHLVLPEKLSYIGWSAFSNCRGLTTVEIPSGIGTLERTFDGCNKIEKIVCRAATPPTVSRDAFESVTKANVTLEVPSFAVATYKLDPYWYQFGNITEGEPSDYWKVIGDLKLLNNRRMEGKPDVDLYYNGKLTIGGDAPMTVGNLDIYTSDKNPSSLVTDCKNFTADEINTIYAVDANKWYFITPMVDVDLRQVNVTGTSNYVFRYYDGATRADIGAGTSWKNVSDMKLKAGVGYIFQCTASSDVIFPVPVEMHSKILTTESVSLPLTAHPSDNAANKGWNYVGNPFPSYYDIYYMDFTAPITVWTGSTYRAYSISDDNYVLRPMQGFFVQKPDAVDVITLQPAGRQIESTVNRIVRNEIRSKNNLGQDRFIFNVEISSDTENATDLTRIVLNRAASVGYEVERDATKFMSMDETVPQIFSIDNDNNRLAINERPTDTGLVPLGVYIPDSNKIYTINASRMDGDAILYDSVIGLSHDLSTGGYTFTAENGISDNRFSIRVKPDIISGVKDITDIDHNVRLEILTDGMKVKGANGQTLHIHTLEGTTVFNAQLSSDCEFIRLAKGVYVMEIDNDSYKVVIK